MCSNFFCTAHLFSLYGCFTSSNGDFLEWWSDHVRSQAYDVLSDPEKKKHGKAPEKAVIMGIWTALWQKTWGIVLLDRFHITTNNWVL